MLLRLLAVALVCMAGAAHAHEFESTVVEHHDHLTADAGFSLKQLLDETVERYPRLAVAEAMQQEAGALKRRGDSWMPGYPQLYVQYIDDAVGMDKGIHQIQTGVQIPLWMWGQREAGQALAQQADVNAAEYRRALSYEVAGLLRELLWNIALADNRHFLAKQVYEVSNRLVDTVRLRVDAGDLARADWLLAQSDNLEKRGALADAEAELMHARQAYYNLTRQDRAPAAFDEQRTTAVRIADDHPALAAANAAVARAQAEVGWTKKSKQGNQPSVLIGTQHDWFQRGMARDDSTNFIVQVPFGGSDYNAPVEAQANLALNEAIAGRDQLARDLEKALHEAKHNLDVDQAKLKIAQERKTVAERHLDISRVSFEAGEMELLDLLKIEAATRTAIRDADQIGIQLKRDIARYNQVIGEMP